MTRASCGVSEEELWNLVDGSDDSALTVQLPDGAASGDVAVGPGLLLAHTRDCPHCRERLAELARLHAGLEGLSNCAPSPLPERIGAYSVTRLIGEGAMGVVYEAEQQNPARRVAIKVLRPLRRIDEHALRAFRREIAALARLHHPGIATIYDAGQLDDGQPFFAMQFAEGRSIDRWVAAAGSDARQICGLVARVARALHFAHQRGILHRDLKPAHVIVDDAGDPLLLDFGLARPIDDDAGLSLSLTGPGAVVGTLPYMSPEQVRGDRTAVDTRSDVYSLGVILYELLVGERPYAVSSNVVEAAAAIAESRPPHPSDVAAGLPRELGDVVLKALAKEPDRRYASAAALADDLDRFLAGEAVSARPASFGYQLRVFARRHRLAVGAGMLLIVVLTAGIVATSVALFDAERQHREAKLVTELLTEGLGELDPFVGGPDPTLRDVVDKIAERLKTESLFGADSLHEASVRTTIGIAYRHLGEYELALPQLQAAYEIRRHMLAPGDPVMVRTAYEYAQALDRDNRGEAAMEIADAALAAHELSGLPDTLTVAALLRLRAMHTRQTDLRSARRMLEAAESIAARMPPSVDRTLQWSWIYNELSAVCRYEGAPQGSLSNQLRSYEIRREESPLHPHMEHSLYNLSSSLRDFARPSAQRELETLGRAGLEWDARWVRMARLSDRRVLAAVDLATAHMARGEVTDVLAVLQAVEHPELRELGAEWNADLMMFRWLPITLTCCARHLAGDVEGAQRLANEVGAEIERAEPAPDNRTYWAITWLRQVTDASISASAFVGEPTPLQRVILRSQSIAHVHSQRRIGPQDSRSPLRLATSWALRGFARDLDLTGPSADARDVWQALVELPLLEVPDASSFGYLARRRLLMAAARGEALLELGRLAEAETVVREHLALVERTRGPEDALRVEPARVLARIFAARGEFGAAEQILAGVLATMQTSHGPDHVDFAATQREHAVVLFGLGRHPEAVGLLRAALHTFSVARGPSHPECAVTQFELGRCLHASGARDEAERSFAAAARIARNLFGPESRLAKDAERHLLAGSDSDLGGR